MRDQTGQVERRHELFSARSIILLPLGFVAVFAAMNRIVRFIDLNWVHFERPPFWPIGVFEFRRPDAASILIACACAAAFGLFVLALERTRYSLALIITAGLTLALGSNLIQGVEMGLRAPVSGDAKLGPKGEIQYYHDAVDIESAGNFLSRFNSIQPLLRDHARTHPPGAVLTYYFLHKWSGKAEWTSAIIAAISVICSAIFLNGLARQSLKDEFPTGFVVFLCLIAPAWQIYSCSSLDALIATAFLGTIHFLSRSRHVLNYFGLAICLFISSFLTFAFLFLIPVALIYEYLRRKTIPMTLASLFVVAIAYTLLARFAGFNYYRAFTAASHLENPRGFWMLADPASYSFSRLECIGEILIFLGPFLCILLWRSLGHLNHAAPPLQGLVWTAMATLAAMFLTGAFHVAETARACLFIQPFLVLAIGAHFSVRPIPTISRMTLLCLVFAQTLAMQLLGNYSW